jgi:hypothetical protein
MESWLDIVNSDSKSKKKVSFTSLKEGITYLRVLDSVPHARWSHWLLEAKRSVTCIGKDCPVCEIIKQAKANGTPSKYSSRRVFSVNVYNRNTKEVEVLEQGKTFFIALADLIEDEGPPTEYDIKVKKRGQGTSVNYRLDKVDKAFNEDVEGKLVDLKEYFKEQTREEILDMINGTKLIEEKVEAPIDLPWGADEEVELA